MTELVLQVGFSLLVVLGLMWVLARAVRRPLGGRSQGTLAVLNRQQLARGAAVAVVRVGDRALVLGVTEQRVSLLVETPLDEFEKAVPERRTPMDLEQPRQEAYAPASRPKPGTSALAGSLLSPGTWLTTLDFLRERTSRR